MKINSSFIFFEYLRQTCLNQTTLVLLTTVLLMPLPGLVAGSISDPLTRLEVAHWIGFEESFYFAQIYSPLVFVAMTFLFWLLIPFTIIRFVLGVDRFVPPLTSLRPHAPSLIVLFVFMVPLLWLVASIGEFQSFYGQPGLELGGLTLFLIAQIPYFLTFIAFEYLFRRFLVLGVYGDLKSLTLPVSSAIYVLVHLGKPEIEYFVSFIAGLVMGALILNGLKYWQLGIFHGLIAVTLNFFIFLQ